MLNRVKYTECLCCGSNNLIKCFSAVDHTVSKEYFDVWECNKCTFRFTQNAPDANHIGSYYQSNDYISHSDTKSGLINKLYHIARNITLNSKLKLVKSVTQLQHGNILDYGAGTGAFCHTMQKNNWSVTGIEPDDNARSNAQKLYNLHLQKLHYLEQIPASTYDAITLWHVLEHVHDLKGVLSYLNNILKNTGKLIIAVPNYTSYDAGYYKEYWAAYDVPRHLYHFSPKAMQTLLDSLGYKIESYRPMWFDSIYVSMLSEKYKSGKINYLRSAWIGFVSNLKTLFNEKKCSSVIYVASKK